MPRLSRAASREAALRFGHWFSEQLETLGLTLGAVAYGSRALADDGCPELSHSNLRRFADGESAPTMETVLTIVRVLAHKAGTSAPSTLSALSASHPHGIARIVIGLDAMGLDKRWKAFMTEGQLERQERRRKLQERVGLAGFRWTSRIAELRAAQEPANSRKLRTAQRKFGEWVDSLFSHYDLLAVAIAYAYFGTAFGDVESDQLLLNLAHFDDRREATYTEALKRYPTFNFQSDPLSGPQLLRAERALRDDSLDSRDRARMASSIFAVWASTFAEEFLMSVPLLEWVDSDTLRHNLGLPNW